MRKGIVGLHHGQQAGESGQGWLDLEEIATVEVTSEDPRFPIESAFGSEDGRLQKVNSRFESSSTSRYRCGAFNSVSVSLTLKDYKSLSFDGPLPRAASRGKSSVNNGISALLGQRRKLKTIWLNWWPSRHWSSQFSPI